MNIQCRERRPITPEVMRRDFLSSYSMMTYNSINSQHNFTHFGSHSKSVAYECTNTNELLLYLKFLDTNPVIREFLRYDCCYRLADKYLIAMVFVYFKRAHLKYSDFTHLNFFAALCLAHSMEEDDEELCAEIYPWALGTGQLMTLVPLLLELKIHLWQAMDHRAAVSLYCCQQVISINPFHPVWRRERTATHAGAPREYYRHTPPPKGHDPLYDQLTNTCAKCRAVEKPIVNYFHNNQTKNQPEPSPDQVHSSFNPILW